MVCLVLWVPGGSILVE